MDLITSVWKPASVDQVPEIVLANWCVFEVQTADSALRTRHFVGTNITEGSGRVSSPIESFSAKGSYGQTASGRVYALKGPAGGLRGDASYTWGIWKHRNQVVETIDVSASVEEMLERSAD